MKQFSRKRLLVALIIALFCFLVLAASVLSYRQNNRMRNNTLRDVRGDLNLMSVASREALLRSDRAALRNLIKQWGSKRPELRELRVVAPDKSVIAEYKSPQPSVGEKFSLSKEVAAGQRQLATILFHGDFSATDKVTRGIRRTLFSVVSIFTALFGAALWLIVRNIALEPLEDAVNTRTQALVEANREFEQLTNNSPS